MNLNERTITMYAQLKRTDTTDKKKNQFNVLINMVIYILFNLCIAQLKETNQHNNKNKKKKKNRNKNNANKK